MDKGSISLKNFGIAKEEEEADEGRSAGSKLQYLIIFHRDPRTPTMSTDSSQVGVALFPSY